MCVCGRSLFDVVLFRDAMRGLKSILVDSILFVVLIGFFLDYCEKVRMKRLEKF